MYAVLAGVGVVAVSAQQGAAGAQRTCRVAVGFATWLIALSLLTEPLRRAELDDGAAADDVGRPRTAALDRARAS